MSGIPIIQQIDGLERIVEFIESGEPTRALLQAFNVFRVRWAHRSRWHQIRYHLNCRRVVSDPSLTFAEAAQLVRRPKVFADYLVHRYANPNFLAAFGPMLLLHPPQRVLDLGCGAGHASFLMQALHPGLTVVSGDQDFVSLYLARRFLACPVRYGGSPREIAVPPGASPVPTSSISRGEGESPAPHGLSHGAEAATQVCWSAEGPSPFPDQSFDAVFCLDAFHYLSSKKAVVAELRRIATARALWLFPHLHNRLQPNLVAGIPLSPEHYLECFGFPEARLFDETELLRGLTQEHVLNLECSPSVDQLNAAQTLTFIHGGGELWRKHNGFPSALCRNPAQLEINPIYQQRQCSDGLELERSWPNDTLRDECRAAEEILPARCRLNRDDLNLLNAGVKPRGGHPAPAIPRLQELVSRFVLVPLPPRYA